MAGGNKNKAKPNDAGISLQAMVDADRSKRKTEQLAASIFGRKADTNNGNKKNKPVGGSLASRIGVNKRSSSAAPKLNQTRDNRPARQSLANRRTASTPRFERSEKLNASLQREAFTNGSSAHFSVRSNPSQMGQMSIRGIASNGDGPTIVMASNFAAGTSAADIISAMTPIGGEIRNCRILSPRPTVMAEIEFETREGAENVVNTFNNQIADGRVLYVYVKHGGPTPVLGKGTSIKNAAAANTKAPTPPLQTPEVASGDADVEMDVEPQQPVERAPLQASRDEGRLSKNEYYSDTVGNAGYQDGRYGFAEATEERGREARRYPGDDRRYDDRMRGRDDGAPRGYGYPGGGWARGYGRGRGRGGGGGGGYRGR